jgi:hypothetical protein
MRLYFVTMISDIMPLLKDNRKGNILYNLPIIVLFNRKTNFKSIVSTEVEFILFCLLIIMGVIIKFSLIIANVAFPFTSFLTVRHI